MTDKRQQILQDMSIHDLMRRVEKARCGILNGKPSRGDPAHERRQIAYLQSERGNQGGESVRHNSDFCWGFRLTFKNSCLKNQGVDMKVVLIDVYVALTVWYFPATLHCGTLAKCMVYFSRIHVRHFQRQALVYDNMLYLRTILGQD